MVQAAEHSNREGRGEGGGEGREVCQLAGVGVVGNGQLLLAVKVEINRLVTLEVCGTHTHTHTHVFRVCILPLATVVALSENSVSPQRDYSNLPDLHGAPRAGDKIAFKVHKTLICILYAP